ITGQIQSVQWGALSTAGLLTGSIGGYVAQHGLQRPMFLGCGLLGLASLGVVLLVVRESQRKTRSAEEWGRAWTELWDGRRLAIILSAAAFLFLWNFNPFSSNVLQQYMTEEL